MLNGSVTGAGGLEKLVQQLAALKTPDLMPLALDLRETIIDGNREGLLAGTDANGDPMAELAESTYKRGRGGLGPPLVPRFGGSQLVDRFQVDIEPTTEGGVRLKASWPGVEWAKYHRGPTRTGRPARNPFGIRPATRDEIRRIVNKFARSYRAKF